MAVFLWSSGSADSQHPPGASQTDSDFEFLNRALSRGQDVNSDICTWSVGLERINISYRRRVANTTMEWITWESANKGQNADKAVNDGLKMLAVFIIIH